MEPSSILVVDDDQDLREALTEFLSDLGYRVMAVACGRDALARVAAGPAPDLALVDMMMPDLDGAEVARGIAARAPATRIIMMTALPTQRDRDRLRDVGISAFLGKPLKLETLEATIRAAFAERPRH